MGRIKISDDKKHKKVSVSFDPEQLKQLIRYCEKNERSISWVVRKALADWISRNMDTI